MIENLNKKQNPNPNQILVGVKSFYDGIVFTDGTTIDDEHEQDCCEDHYLSYSDLTEQDFEGLLFDISNNDFIRKIEDYGIELVPINGHSVKIPGYADNNGFYSDELKLRINNKSLNQEFIIDITECQTWRY